MHCFSCKREVKIIERIGFKEECLHCGHDLHICMLCKFYDQNSHNECRETMAEFVKDKERANLCEYYKPGDGDTGATAADDAKSKLEALFK